MQNKKLHIISFDNPYPPNYGGIIDVFYKIKALHRIGFEIYLHCFVKNDEILDDELKSVTKEVYFYKKNINPFFLFSKIPFSVRSRFHPELIANIDKIDAPILFEGLQSTMLINKMNIKNRRLYLRLHNIESDYYLGTAKSETNLLLKGIKYLESKKYKRYERIIGSFDNVFTLSTYEHNYVNKYYHNSVYVPVFHGNEIKSEMSEFGNYVFYHGDLRLADNKRAVKYLVDIFKKLDHQKLIIASGNGQDFVEYLIKDIENIQFVNISNFKDLTELLNNAHVNVIISFQKSGTKLKLINSLFRSRHCLINENVVDDEQILQLCHMAESKNDFEKKINELMSLPFADNRNQILKEILSDTKNAQKISEFIW